MKILFDRLRTKCGSFQLGLPQRTVSGSRGLWVSR